MPSLAPTHKPHKPAAPNQTEQNWGKGRGGRPWRRLRQQILNRDHGLCQVCKSKGIYTRATEVDHIIELSQGGTDAHSNLQAICAPCHRFKTGGGLSKSQRL